ncbi:MAG: hypothetical protein EXS13_08560 [Planctomycetes bacterium]|nr:hypothetical protein [Planctomycetota bacterium]
MRRFAKLVFALFAGSGFAHAVSAGAPPVAPTVVAADGVVVEQATRADRELVVRLRSDADLSALQTVAVLVATGSDGQRVEIARAPLDRRIFDRSPRRRARVATARFALPDGAPEDLRIELASGR